MPKTNKPFDWEIYEGGDFVDIISMSRSDMQKFQKNHPEYTVKELGYTDDRTDDSSEINSKKRWDLYSVRVSRK